MPGLNDSMKISDELRVVVTGMGTVNALAGDPGIRRGPAPRGMRYRADHPLRHDGIPHPQRGPGEGFPAPRRDSRPIFPETDVPLRSASPWRRPCRPWPRRASIPFRRRCGRRWASSSAAGPAGSWRPKPSFRTTCGGGRERPFFPPRPGLLRRDGQPPGHAIRPLGAEDDPHDRLLLRGDGHRPRAGPDPQRRRPGDDRRRHGAPLPADLRLLQRPAGGRSRILPPLFRKPRGPHPRRGGGNPDPRIPGAAPGSGGRRSWARSWATA